MRKERRGERSEIRKKKSELASDSFGLCFFLLWVDFIIETYCCIITKTTYTNCNLR